VRIGVAGLGLIGGSLALALRDAHDVTGYDISHKTRDAAGRRGIRVVDVVEALLPADAVIVATPMSAVLPTLEALATRSNGAVLLDTASVRGPIEEFARARDGAAFVGLHPMAGRSAQGFEAADPAMLRGRPFLIVPTTRADSRATGVAGDVARAAGGVPAVCSAVEHDRIVATLSALPLAIAAALSVAGAEAVPQTPAFAGPGYRDATRLASTPADLGEALLMANSPNVIAAISRLRATLDELERAIASRDVTALRAFLDAARDARMKLE
jgi:prephenate dehydrogenase